MPHKYILFSTGNDVTNVVCFLVLFHVYAPKILNKSTDGHVTSAKQLWTQ